VVFRIQEQRSWTASDDAELRRPKAEKVIAFDIGKILDRTSNAVLYCWQRLKRMSRLNIAPRKPVWHLGSDAGSNGI
jgi:hypothetical protein